MSVIDERHEVVARARRARAREHLGNLDYLRGLLEAKALGLTQVELARQFGLTQPTISSSLRTARAVPPVPAGFSGGSPYEIAERFAADEITRERLVEELSRWEYRPAQPTDGLDWMTGDSGEFSETVGRALDEGLIDDETYDEVLRARAARSAPAT
ncbi:hypothetical protein [Cellulomonas sp. Y8]|uniref:hypothetical protein n=1 Tax=Cellulomonas sp. Y8 TaxID=2591145 RepID=UPI003D722053